MSKQPLKAASLARVLDEAPPSIKETIIALPPQSLIKLGMFVSDRDNERREAAALADERMGKFAIKRDIETRIARFNLDLEQRGLAPTKPELAEHKQDIQLLKGIADEINELGESTSPAFSLDAMWDFLAERRQPRWRHKAALFEGTASLAAFDKSNSEVDTIKNRRKHVVGANRPLDEGSPRIEADVRQFARAGDVKPQLVLRNFQGLQGYKQGRMAWSDRPDGSISGERALAIMLDLFGDEIIGKYQRRIKAGFNPKTALATHDRERALAKIDDELLYAERVNEAIYLACRRSGLHVSRRSNAALLALLELEADPDAKRAMTPAAGATRGSLQIVKAHDKDDLVQVHEDDFG
ncbi:hypothetical protein AB8A31_15805 [Tardiphaga sp. 804_B3_N1_9]|uniref:hypothetical protein n=1 Tax=Tardiphaga sp. 804_B3_N1_9 TaxID=3240786 RepID=UPI003F204EAF